MQFESKSIKLWKNLHPDELINYFYNENIGIAQKIIITRGLGGSFQSLRRQTITPSYFLVKQAKLKKIVDNFKNLPKNKTDDKLSMFHAKFSLNDVPCELEYDLSMFYIRSYKIMGYFKIVEFLFLFFFICICILFYFLLWTIRLMTFLQRSFVIVTRTFL